MNFSVGFRSNFYQIVYYKYCILFYYSLDRFLQEVQKSIFKLMHSIRQCNLYPLLFGLFSMALNKVRRSLHIHQVCHFSQYPYMEDRMSPKLFSLRIVPLPSIQTVAAVSKSNNITNSSSSTYPLFFCSATNQM